MTEKVHKKTDILYFGQGKCRLYAEAGKIGTDILVRVWGGEKPHIGSVAVSVADDCIGSDGKFRATTSVFNLPGHREDEITRMFSSEIAVALGTTTVVCAGVHIESITVNEISEIMENARELCSLVISTIGG